MNDASRLAARVLVVWLLTTTAPVTMTSACTVVSSQTTSTRAANLLASFIIIPMTLLIQGESIIMFLAPDADSPNGIGALWAIIAGMFVVVLLLLRLGNSVSTARKSSVVPSTRSICVAACARSGATSVRSTMPERPPLTSRTGTGAA